MTEERAFETTLNYRRLSAKVVTAGQPSEAQLGFIAEAGFEVVVNLGLAGRDCSLPDERRLVESLGLRYVHIPVEWERPTSEDLARFIAVMREVEGKPVFVHCAANKRVSVFMALYRILVLGWSREAALREVAEVWEPNEVRQRFIDSVLANPPQD